MAINNVVLTGRLTYEPEIRQTPDGVKVANFQIAADRDYTDKDGKRQADFVDCVAWRGRAEFLEKYFHKGSEIAIIGSISTRTFEDKDGKTRKAVEVVANTVNFNGRRKDTKPEDDADTAADSAADDDIEETVLDGDFEEIEDDDDFE